MNSPEHDPQKSKSQIKREFQALKELVKQLIELPDSKLSDLPISEAVQEAVQEAKSLTRGALQRHLRFVTQLMPNEDLSGIEQGLAELRFSAKQRAQAFQQIEQWRDLLMAGDKALLDELIARFSHLDRQHLNQLIRNACKEKAADKPPKAARQLFRYLADLEAEKP